MQHEGVTAVAPSSFLLRFGDFAMAYERPRPMLADRQLALLRCLSPAGIRRTRPEVVSALGGCCSDAVAVELRRLTDAGLLRTHRPPEGLLQYELTAQGAEVVDRG